MLSAKDSIRIVLSWVSTVLLYIIGWKTTMHEQSFQLINTYKGDLVLLFQHTSYTDLFYGLLYVYANGISERLYFVMGNFVADEYWYLRPFFAAIGCVYVPSITCASPQGTVTKIADMLMEDTTCRKIILIAPTGTTKSNLTTPWRTGWYYLAKRLGADVGVIGVNFHPLIRTVHLGHTTLSEKRFYNPEILSLEECIEYCKTDMQGIYPRWSQHSPVPLKTPIKHIETLVLPGLPHFTYYSTPAYCVQFIDWVVFTANAFWIPVFASWKAGCYDLTLLGVLSTIASVNYHRSYEYSTVWHDRDVICAYCSFYYFMLRVLFTLEANVWFLWGLALCCCFQIYCVACPRKQYAHSVFRSANYQTFHPLFHVVVATVVFSYCSMRANL